jgi:DNA polymerase-3 subunit delta
VLWVLSRELRKLAAVGFVLMRRGDTAAVLREHKVTEYRRNEVVAAARRLPLPRLWGLLVRCADADLAIKGRSAADPWRLLAEIADGLAATAARAGR